MRRKGWLNFLSMGFLSVGCLLVSPSLVLADDPDLAPPSNDKKPADKKPDDKNPSDPPKAKPVEKPADMPAEKTFAGQADLDEAIEQKLSVKNLNDLSKVVDLCESALRKGIDDDNRKLAVAVLTSSLLQRAEKLAEPILEVNPPSPQWPRLRAVALRDLKRALELDAKLGSAHLLSARLEGLPGGNRSAALASADKAVELLKDDTRDRSRALMVRGSLQEDPADQQKDLEEALKVDGGNTEARRARGLFLLTTKKYEDAIKDFQQVLEKDKHDAIAHEGMVEALTSLKRFDEAIKHADAAVKADADSPVPYLLRARVLIMQEKVKEALADTDSAVRIAPKNISALLLRARLRLASDEKALAKSDINRVLEIAPGLTQAILLRSMLSADEGKFNEAIHDIQKLIKEDPEDNDLKGQLATYYVLDERPRKAIDVYTEILADDGENIQALRGRADALLSIGKHAEAIQDFEAVHKIKEDDSGILNNYAWVLCTSPNDKLRDGKRAIELAKKACELTKFKAPHILSTLAAAYAETGDFETATKISKQAIEVAKQEKDEKKKEQVEALEKELENYKQRKPVRELQEKQDKADPPPLKDEDFKPKRSI